MDKAVNTIGEKESKLIGTGEGESPLAEVPFKKLEMRTMNSDMSSITENGGGAPQPYTPTGAPTASSQPQQESFTIGNVPPTPPMTPQSSFNQNTSGGGNKKTFIWVIIALAILIILAAAYFFLYPALKDEVKDDEMVSSSTPSAVQEQNPVSATPTITGPDTIEIHASYLKNPADITSEIKPETFTATGIKSAIQPASTSIPLFKELIVKSKDNKPLALSSFTNAFFPDYFTTERLLNFENDFTFISYTNKTGTWLGLAAKLKASSDSNFAQNDFKAFQTEENLKDFYLSDPGNQLQWKAGKVAGKNASILEFSTRGVEFTYVWVDRYLVISSNLEAATEIVKRLGF